MNQDNTKKAQKGKKTQQRKAGAPTYQGYTIAWTYIPPDNPIMKRIGAPTEIPLPILVTGKHMTPFREHQIIPIFYNTILCGLMLGPHEPTRFDKRRYQKYYDNALRMTMDEYGYSSLEKFMLDAAAYIRINHGPPESSKALLTALQYFPSSSTLHSDYVADIWTQWENGGFQQTDLPLLMLRHIDEIQIDQLDKEFRPLILYMKLASLMKTGQVQAARELLQSSSTTLKENSTLSEKATAAQSGDLSTATLALHLEDELAAKQEEDKQHHHRNTKERRGNGN
jgi:hypothetical protein